MYKGYDRDGYPCVKLPKVKISGPSTTELTLPIIERCVVISDRDYIIPDKWPWPRPMRFKPIRGKDLPVPAGWLDGPGAYGCHLSHLQILRDAILDGVNTLLVLEEDCRFVDCDLHHILSQVPADWDQIMLGGQVHPDGQVLVVNDTIRQVSRVERTHAYILSKSAIRSLYQYWSSTAGHCDQRMSEWQDTGKKVYAPIHFVAYQEGGWSTVSDVATTNRIWDNVTIPHVPYPCILHCPEDVADKLVVAEIISLYEPDTRPTTPIVAFVNPPDVKTLKREYRPFQEVWGETFEDLEYQFRIAIHEQKPWTDKLTVFYHIACMGNWKSVATEQLKLLTSSGLTDIKIGCTVGYVTEVADLCDKLKIKPCVVATGRLDEYEVPTLLALEKYARFNDGAVLYLHTKGVSAPDDKNKVKWRHLMQNAIVPEWRKHLELLHVNDILGVNWMNCQRPHYCGNFWMARCDWLRRLPDLLTYRENERGTIVSGNKWERMCAELWLGSASRPHLISLITHNEKLWIPGVIDSLESKGLL